MKSITLDYRTFLKGFSKSNYYPDGGFSPDSVGIEVDRDGSNYGLLQPGRLLVDNSTGLSSEVVSSAKGKLGSDQFGSYLISSGGKIYHKPSSYVSTHTLKHTETNKTYDTNSHCIIYKGVIYITSTTDIYRDDGTFGVNDYRWWTFTKTKTALTTGIPHKMFVFQGTLYILNGNKIASWDGTTAKDAAFTLDDGWVIVDVSVSGEDILLLATKNYSSYEVNGENKIFVWNGISTTTWLREIEIFSATVQAIIKVESGFYFFSSNSIYFTDGYSYKFVYITNTQTHFNKIALNRGIIYFGDILAWNTKLNILTKPVVVGSQIRHFNVTEQDYFNIWTNNGGVYNCYYAVSNAYTAAFRSNPIDFGTPVQIKAIELVLKTNLSSTYGYTVNLYDESNLGLSPRQLTLNNADSRYTGKYKIVAPVNLYVNTLYFILTWTAGLSPAIKYIKIHYEPSERNTTV
jgi:hypothetical protein